MSGSADCGNLWQKRRTGIFGLTLRVFLCCYVSSILSFIFLRKREGRKGINHVHNRALSGSVKKNIDAISSAIL
jgi:hypothetical protein